MNTGEYLTFDEKTPLEDFADVILASASIPMVFPSVPYKDHLLMDGGTVWNTNLVSAVDKCKELVDDDSKIILDIVFLH